MGASCPEHDQVGRASPGIDEATLIKSSFDAD